MFFFFAKIFGFVLLLPHLLLELTVLGAILLWFERTRRAGRALVTAGSVLLATISFLPVYTLLLLPLENRFPQPQLTQAPTGIIVLGGAVQEGVTSRRGLPALNESAERMTEAVALSLKYPSAKLVFSGGSALFSKNGMTESDVARKLWLSLGAPPEKMIFEDRSRDTWENVVYLKELIKPQPGETWLLVTSAAHMPRSIGIFRKVGFPVVAYPVDYRTGGGPGDFVGFRNMSAALLNIEQACHEWFGLLSYYVTGKTSELFPGP